MNDASEPSHHQSSRGPASSEYATISAREVRRLMVTRHEVALLDVREEGAYAQAHPLLAASLPVSQLELQILDRVPRCSTTIVVYDDDGRLSLRAQEILRRLGYSDVRTLCGGLEGWRQTGYQLFQDVNSASKAFGELVEARRDTPSIPPQELRRLLDSGDNVVVLDSRRFDEFQTMTIPSAVSTPGAELVLRATSLAPDPATRIIVNCAGRTRSIIGAQSLLNAGLHGRVAALRDGAIGWSLAGLDLEHGAARRSDSTPLQETDAMRRRAREVAYRAGVRHIDVETLDFLRGDPIRTTYCFDVRQPAEFETRHASGFRNAPGGQLVQETDVSAPVRGARIVLHDPLGARADMTASWLAQMGWDTYVLDDLAPCEATGPDRPQLPPLPQHGLIAADALAEKLSAQTVQVLDLGPSPERARAHIPGSWFVIRSMMAEALQALGPPKPLVLCSPDGVLAAFAAPEVEALTGAAPMVLQGGLAAWRARGLPVEAGLGDLLSPTTDVYKRPYEGVGNGHAAMRAYIDWEHGLVEQLARDASHGFVVI